MEVRSKMTKISKQKESIAEKILKISNFLASPRTAEEIKKELKDKLGHSLKLTDIRVNLLYLLRRGKIKRKKDGAEEYKYHI